MKNTYINLFKLIYESEELTIEPIGIKIKDLNAETLTTHLFPILELDDLKEEPIIPEIEIPKLKQIYQLYKKYQELDLLRIALIGSDAKKIYDILVESELTYEDEFNKTIIKEDEIYLTTKNRLSIIKNIIEQKKVLAIIYDFQNVYEYNGVLPDKITNIKYSKKNINFERARKGRKIPNYLLFNLLESLGFTHQELDAVMALIELDDKYIEFGINQINTKLMKTFIENFESNSFYNRAANKLRNNYLKELIDNYPTKMIIDLTFDEAVKLYVRS